MFISKYDPEKNHDKALPKFVSHVKKNIKTLDDDFLLLLVGDTGSGKSNLMMYIYELFDPIGCDVTNIAFDFKQFSKAIKDCLDKDSERFVSYDEANINSRNAMTSENKDIIDLYMTIRGLNIFSVWCNPSANMIDKVFIEERIKGLIYVHGSGKVARDYYYFNKNQMLSVLKKHGNLKLDTLKKSKSSAFYQGWFKEYKGRLKSDYLDDKDSRMRLKIENFFEKYGEGLKSYPATKMSKLIDCSPNTVVNRHKKFLSEGVFKEGVHFKVSSVTGKTTWFESSIPIFTGKAVVSNGDLTDCEPYTNYTREKENFEPKKKVAED